MSERNAAAFLREDTTSVHVTYIGVGASEKTYTYVTNLKLAEDDLVLVPVRDGEWALAKVAKVDDDLCIEPKSNIQYKWIGQKVDLTAYNDLLEANAKLEQVVRDSYRHAARRSFRAGLLEGLPMDQQDEIKKLLGN